MRRKVEVGAETICRGCGKRIESGYQAGRFSRGEFCSLRCAKTRWKGRIRPDHSAWMRDCHADKRAAREQQAAVLRSALEKLEMETPRTNTPLGIANEVREQTDPLVRALEKLRAEKALSVTRDNSEPDNPPESPDTPELLAEMAVTSEPETVPSPDPIEPKPLPGGTEADLIERENERLAKWASEILSRAR